jgi:AraC-like DNA-binding protein
MAIFTIEDRDFFDLSPCDVGYEECAPSKKFGPHVRNYYLIHFVVSGRGNFKNQNGEYTLGTGEAFLIRPGEVTVYEADASEPWRYAWLGFRGKLADRFIDVGDVFTYEPSVADEIIESFSFESGRAEFLTGVLFKLYARMFNAVMRTDYINKVKNYITSHYMEDLSISDVAENVGLNRKYLARIFKAAEGIGMKEYLINKRLHEGKKLLLLGYNVEECAYMVGYNDPFGFSKAFKRKYGVSPIAVKFGA